MAEKEGRGSELVSFRLITPFVRREMFACGRWYEGLKDKGKRVGDGRGARLVGGIN